MPARHCQYWKWAREWACLRSSQHLLSHSPLRCAVQRKMVQYQTTHRHRQRSQAKELCSNKVPHRGPCQILGGHIPCRGHHRPPQHPRRIVRHRQAARSSRQVAECRLSAFSARRWQDIVNYIRQRHEAYPEWHNSATAQLFSPPVFKNKKNAAGYFFQLVSVF